MKGGKRELSGERESSEMSVTVSGYKLVTGLIDM